MKRRLILTSRSEWNRLSLAHNPDREDDLGVKSTSRTHWDLSWCSDIHDWLQMLRLNCEHWHICADIGKSPLIQTSWRTLCPASAWWSNNPTCKSVCALLGFWSDRVLHLVLRYRVLVVVLRPYERGAAVMSLLSLIFWHAETLKIWESLSRTYIYVCSRSMWRTSAFPFSFSLMSGSCYKHFNSKLLRLARRLAIFASIEQNVSILSECVY